MKKFKLLFLFVLTSLVYTSCNDDDDLMVPEPSGNTVVYQLGSKDVDGIFGKATFVENTDASVTVVLDIEGTPSDGLHPAHIHFNTAAEGGDIALTFTPVDGNSGLSATTFTTLNDGTAISYAELLNFDGYINVHLSADELGTVVAQGDIGQNALSGTSIIYDLGEKDVTGISGNITFSERNNGETLAVIELDGTPAGGSHPAHIHANTAAETGAILYTFNTVNGDTGTSVTSLSSLMFSDIEDIDAYVNVHLSMDNLATIVAQGDIGQNDLTGTTKVYDLGEKDVVGISGDITFSERVNGEALAVIDIANTPAGGMHPAHIHANTAAESGAILFTFNVVNGDTGMSATNVDAYSYADILDIDAYVNVHLSATQLSTIVAQGDIGQNDLTGSTIVYDLGEKDVAGISGDITFSERVNGEALAVIDIANTPAGGMHPAHIHENTAAETGGILFTFNVVDGDTGMSVTNVDTIDYSAIEDLDAYVNVHLSATQLGTIVAQGDIGRNDLTGDSKVYTLNEKDVAGIMGTATFYKRVDGSSLAVLDIENTVAGEMHPSHIHENDAATGGPIAFSFNPVNGDTGLSMTQVEELDDSTAITYDEILTFDGYINVHLSATQLSTIVAQGNIGSNE
ncbi:CHRD domain-containing protein [Polaribacter dokdonensis]|uniref:CHRD domain-containing protein n=1 Tax=Polaribacter dokdonensis DSW-5 TaxID=1300348 RepID=A0A1H5J5B0_9FLAO|nr:CHRD domain-containing protein [Polaribacter dokdonensis]SEE47715.1 hypothetical protein SAMN05444353_1880 [Polaribacter dokdonensis DSW-5]